MSDLDELETIVVRSKDDPDENYPPKGTPNECLVILIDQDNFHVLGWTGRFFHGQCVCAGFSSTDEIGIDHPDEDLDPGYYVMEKGRPWATKDWESNVFDDYGIAGIWRKATRADFDKFNVGWPFDDPASSKGRISDFESEDRGSNP